MKEQTNQLWEIWNSILEYYRLSENKKSDIWKVVSITNFFIGGISKIEYLNRENDQAQKDIDNKTKSNKELYKDLKRIESLANIWQSEKDFFLMKDEIKEQYEKTLDQYLKEHDNHDNEILNVQTFDELLEKGIKRLEEKLNNRKTTLKSLQDFINANKFLINTKL